MELRRLRALGLPDKGERQFKEMLVAMEEGIEEGERNHASMQGVESDYAFAKAFDLGVAVGIKSCWLD